MTTGGADSPKGALGDAPARLKARSQFVAVGRGARFHARSFVLQIGAREGDDPPRFGLTVTKKTIPLAVRRNRIRRRLREALRLGAALSGAPGRDYVLVARAEALKTPFADLRAEIADAMSAPVRDKSPNDRRSTR